MKLRDQLAMERAEAEDGEPEVSRDEPGRRTVAEISIVSRLEAATNELSALGDHHPHVLGFLLYTISRHWGDQQNAPAR